MAVKRIVANIRAEGGASAKAFYCDVLDMTVAMDLGWITTFVADAQTAPQVTAPQISVATDGGSGTPVPDISIEVDNFEEVYRRAVSGGYTVEYGPVREPWGIHRFYVRDPFGRMINILTHDLTEGT